MGSTPGPFLCLTSPTFSRSASKRRKFCCYLPPSLKISTVAVEKGFALNRMFLKSEKPVLHIRVWGTAASKTKSVERHEWHLLCSLWVTAEAQSILNLRPYTHSVVHGKAGRGTREMCTEVVLGCFLSGTV